MTEASKQFNHGLRSFLTFRLAQVQNRLNTQAGALLRAHCDLSLTEWRVISLANLLGATTATVMSREAQMDKGQVSRAVKQLIENGYLTSKSSENDARQSILSLSDSGAELHARLITVMRDRQMRLIQNISESDLRTFYKVLDTLAAQSGPVPDDD